MQGGRVSILEMLVKGIQKRLDVLETPAARPVEIVRIGTTDSSSVVTITLDPPLRVIDLPPPLPLAAAGRSIAVTATETKLADGRTSSIAYSFTETVSQPAVKTTASLLNVSIGATIGKTDAITRPAGAGIGYRIRIVANP